jgi:hypothetical protein
MTSQNPLLRTKLLTHWQNYHPKMVEELQRENRLEEALETKVEQIIDLLYELEIVQGMDYSAAWEIALDQYFLPEEEDEPAPTEQDWNLRDPATFSE